MKTNDSTNVQLDSLDQVPPEAASSGELALVMGNPSAYDQGTICTLGQYFGRIFFVADADPFELAHIHDMAQIKKFAAVGFGLPTEFAELVSENLTQLEVLILNDNRIAAAGLRAIGEIESLQVLAVANNGVGRAVVSLAKLWQLTSLDISENSLGGKKVMPLGELGNLESLTLDSCHIYSPHLSVLSQLPKLKFLSIANNNIGDDGAEILADLGSLTSLHAGGNGIGPEGKAALSRTGRITELMFD